MKRQKHKHWFEIIAYAEGWEILRHYNKKEWDNTPGPLWFNKTIYVVNDALVEFRKAEKLGEQIQHIQDQWSDIELESWNPSDNYNVDNFRIKPSEPDFSILNEEDVFYCKTSTNREYLFAGGNKAFKMGRGISLYKCETETTSDCWICDKEHVIELRKATPEETALFYKHFPELEPPKVGDWGWFWGQCKSDAVLSSLVRTEDNWFYSGRAIASSNFQKIDTSKTLDEIIKEFGL